MGALAQYNVPNVGRMKKDTMIEALLFYTLTDP